MDEEDEEGGGDADAAEHDRSMLIGLMLLSKIWTPPAAGHLFVFVSGCSKRVTEVSVVSIVRTRARDVVLW
jgi:hypothetical protein